MSRGSKAQARRRSRRVIRRAALGVSKAQDQAAVTAGATEEEIPAEFADADGDDDGDKMGDCANCGHAYSMHSGDGGACMADGCDCSSYSKASSETAAADSPIESVRFLFDQGVISADDLLAIVSDGATEVDLPAEHTPGEAMPRRRSSPAAPSSVVVPSGTLAWTATLAPEGKATDDGRIFAPGSITWRKLPLSLMAMTKTADGHDGAEVAGRIDRIWRDGEGASTLIRASGVFDSGEVGTEIARLVSDGTLRGVSVDIAPQKVDIAYRSQVVDENGYWLEEQETASEDGEEEQGPTLVDLLVGNPEDDVIYVVREAVLGMATVCPFQAFADATIETEGSLVSSASPVVWTVTMQGGWVLTASGAPEGETEALAASGEALTASAAGIAPTTPPLDWFDDPDLPELTALTVTPEGRVYGHAAPWGFCHIGFPDSCRTAPETATNYAYFHLKEVECEDGSRVACGTISLDTGHADRNLGRVDAARHYDNTGTAVADVKVGEDEHGIWVAGALRGTVGAETARKLRGASLSGDWRSVDGNLELVALLAVNVPGFPIPRPVATLVASADGKMEVETLIAAGVHMGLGGLTADERAQFERLRAATTDEWDEIREMMGEAA